jgi:hypothetical protein
VKGSLRGPQTTQIEREYEASLFSTYSVLSF